MRVFKYACQYGCEICVKLLLDRSEEKEIDLNKVQLQEEERYHRDPYQFINLNIACLLQTSIVKVTEKMLWICSYVVQKQKASIFIPKGNDVTIILESP